MRLTSQAGKELILGRVPFVLLTSLPITKSNSASALSTSAKLQIGPINVPLGRPTPLRAQLSLSRSGYAASIRGEAGLKRLLQSAQLLHLPSPQAVCRRNQLHSI